MRCFPPTLLLLACTFSGCIRAQNEVTIGAPPSQPLRTTELARDADQRIELLASQLPITANSIFTSYAPNGASKWARGWPRRLDLTGVSWKHKQAGTAITPRHIVFAAHYQMKLGTVLTFHDRSGKVHNRTLIKSISLRGDRYETNSDITVGLLDTPLPSSIKTYRLLPPRRDYPQTLPGCPAFVTEQGRRVYIHEIARQGGNSISFRKDPALPAELYKNLIVGDSGNPTFLLVGGEPVLIETHTGGGGGSGPFYSAPAVFAALRKAVAELDPSYQIQNVPLDPKLAPEPPTKEMKKENQETPRVRRVTRPGIERAIPEPSIRGKRKPRVRRVPVPSGESRSLGPS